MSKESSFPPSKMNGMICYYPKVECEHKCGKILVLGFCDCFELGPSVTNCPYCTCMCEIDKLLEMR